MLPTLQFTEFHKFLVSVGGLLVAAAVALPVYVLRSHDAILVTRGQMQDLSPAARRALSVQQHQSLWMAAHWPWFSIALAIVGLVSLAWGAVNWHGRQKMLNAREIADLRKVEAEKEKIHHEGLLARLRLNRESVEDTVSAIADDLTASDVADERQSFQGDTTSELNTPQDSSTEMSTTASDEAAKEALAMRLEASATSLETAILLADPQAKGVLRYVQTQQMIMVYLHKLYGGHLDFVREVRVGGDRADVVVASRTPRLPNLLVNVKTLLRPSIVEFRRSLERGLEWASKAPTVGRIQFSIDFRPLVFVVMPESMSLGGKIDAARLVVSDLLRSFELPSGVTVVLANQASIQSLPLDGGFILAQGPYFYSTDAVAARTEPTTSENPAQAHVA